MQCSNLFIMRITGGRARGITLKCPRGETRPATDAMRESLGSSLSVCIPEARVLDLYAGTGAYGLELLSRGAASVAFVESHVAVMRVLRENAGAVCRALGMDAQACIRRHASEARAFLRREATGSQRVLYDFIVADPPYAQLEAFYQSSSALVAEVLARHGNARFILEMPGEEPERQFEGLVLLKRLGKRKGNGPSLCVYGWPED